MDTSWKLVFRNRMKQKGVTYATLAKKLNMSVPGAKKIFQKNDLGLERFNRICQILDLDAAEVIRSNSRDGLKLKRLSPEADAYLLKEPRAFYFYWLLLMERLELDEAANELGIKKTDCYKFLRKFDSLGLVRWSEGDKITVPEEASFVFSPSNNSAVRFARDCAHALIEEACGQKPSKTTHFSERYVSLPEHKLILFSQRLSELIDEISREYPHQGRRRAKEQGLIPTRFLFCMLPGMLRP